MEPVKDEDRSKACKRSRVGSLNWMNPSSLISERLGNHQTSLQNCLEFQVHNWANYYCRTPKPECFPLFWRGGIPLQSKPFWGWPTGSLFGRYKICPENQCHQPELLSGEVDVQNMCFFNEAKAMNTEPENWWLIASRLASTSIFGIFAGAIVSKGEQNDNSNKTKQTQVALK